MLFKACAYFSHEFARVAALAALAAPADGRDLEAAPAGMAKMEPQVCFRMRHAGFCSSHILF